MDTNSRHLVVPIRSVFVKSLNVQRTCSYFLEPVSMAPVVIAWNMKASSGSGECPTL